MALATGVDVEFRVDRVDFCVRFLRRALLRAAVMLL